MKWRKGNSSELPTQIGQMTISDSALVFPLYDEEVGLESEQACFQFWHTVILAQSCWFLEFGAKSQAGSKTKQFLFLSPLMCKLRSTLYFSAACNIHSEEFNIFILGKWILRLNLIQVCLTFFRNYSFSPSVAWYISVDWLGPAISKEDMSFIVNYCAFLIALNWDFTCVPGPQEGKTVAASQPENGKKIWWREKGGLSITC